MSEEIEKTTLPGNKQVIRVFEDPHSSRPSFDVICLDQEKVEGIEKLKVWEPFTEISREVVLENVQVKSQQLMIDGMPCFHQLPLSERRKQCMNEFKLFGGAAALLNDDDKSDSYKVYLSDELNTLLKSILAQHGRQ